MEELRRELNEMTYDKAFVLDDGNEQLCHATGFQVCFGNPEQEMNWWNEYEDSKGNLHYGR